MEQEEEEEEEEEQEQQQQMGGCWELGLKSKRWNGGLRRFYGLCLH